MKILIAFAVALASTTALVIGSDQSASAHTFRGASGQVYRIIPNMGMPINFDD